MYFIKLFASKSSWVNGNHFASFRTTDKEKAYKHLYIWIAQGFVIDFAKPDSDILATYNR